MLRRVASEGNERAEMHQDGLRGGLKRLCHVLSPKQSFK